MEIVEAEITILSYEEGGRIQPLSLEAFNCNYRPHIVIGDPNQREALFKEVEGHPRTIVEDYLGVAFLSGNVEDLVPADKPVNVKLALMYYPEIEYIEVTVGATFTIREGGKVVGFGKVNNRYHGK